MTRQLLLVHGRAQEKKDSVALKAEWLDALHDGLAKSNLSLPIREEDVRFPFYGDTLYDMVEVERAERLIERGTIEIAPIAFMRGRTLNDAFVILDEAQNTTSEQMKMFLTRLGFGSKAVVTGDITQIDLPTGRVSGLVEAMKVVANVEGISFIHFDDRDVVRHKLVQQIVKAYESFTTGKGGQV